MAEANDARAQFVHPDGDHLTLLNVYEAYREVQNQNGSNGKAIADWCWNNFLDHRSLKSADSVRKQLVRIMQRLRLPMLSPGYNSKDYYVNIRKCILSGFFTQVAFLDRSGHYSTVRDEQIAALHPGCSLRHRPQWVIYNEFVFTTKNYLREVTEVKGEWLLEVAPHYFDLRTMKKSEAKAQLERLHIKREREALARKK